MRVAIILNKTARPETGGTYSFERELITSLIEFKDNTEHSFYIFGWEKISPFKIPGSSNIRYIFIFSPFYAALKIYRKIPRFRLKKPLELIGNKLFNSSFEEDRILRALLKNEIDMTWNWGLSCPVRKLPYIATVWDLQHRLQPYFPEFCTDLWNDLEKYYLETLGKASLVITGTEAGKKEVQNFYRVPKDRIRVLPFPTPSFALNSCATEKSKLSNQYHLPASLLDCFLFYPAKFATYKNHANLLLSLRYLKDEFNLKISAIFAGAEQGSSRYITQLINDLNLQNQIYILGFIPLGDLAAFYHYAFALTFVSLHGPDNLPPLEAFALGCPVIASNVPGSEEQLGEAALLIDSKDPKQIALAIKSLMDNPNLREGLIQKGLLRASQWTGKDYIKEVCSILDEFASIRRCWGSSKSCF
jgi:glycosyltransferase involved in cell wall biosynthesis